MFILDVELLLCLNVDVMQFQILKCGTKRLGIFEYENAKNCIERECYIWIATSKGMYGV